MKTNVGCTFGINVVSGSTYKHDKNACDCDETHVCAYGNLFDLEYGDDVVLSSEDPSKSQFSLGPLNDSVCLVCILHI